MPQVSPPAPALSAREIVARTASGWIVCGLAALPIVFGLGLVILER